MAGRGGLGTAGQLPDAVGQLHLLLITVQQSINQLMQVVLMYFMRNASELHVYKPVGEWIN